VKRTFIALTIVVCAFVMSAAEQDKRPGWIGIAATMHTTETGSQRGDWLIVRGLDKGGPCEKAGLRLQDTIVAIDGKPVAFENLVAMLDFFGSLQAAKPVKFTIVRANAKQIITVTPTRMSDEQYERWKQNRARAKEYLEHNAPR